MYKKTILSIAIASTITLTGCSDNNDNAGAESNPPTPESFTYPVFNPALSLFPVPNDMMVEKKSNGTGLDGTYVASSQLSALDYLDGAGVSAAYDIPTSGVLDASTIDGEAFIPSPNPAHGGMYIPNPYQTVFLLDITYPGGDELSSTPGLDLNADGTLSSTPGVDLDADGLLDLSEIPTLQPGVLYKAYATAFQTWAADPLNQTKIDAKDAAELALLTNSNYRAELVTQNGADTVIRILPRAPLNPKSKYLVVVTNGIKDAQGNPIEASPSYKNLADTTTALGTQSLLPVRNAIVGWERLAMGWFTAATNGSRAAFGLSALTNSNIALSLTFTTGGTDTVLKAMAAPETFLIQKATITAKQAGISKLFDGTINFPVPVPTSLLDGYFKGLVTTSSSPAYIAKVADGTYTSYVALATAVATGAEGVSSTDLYKAQSAAAIANLSVVNGDAGPGVGNGTTIKATAIGTAAALVGGGVLTRPASGITDKNGDTFITVQDTFIPIATTTPTGAVSDYQKASASIGLTNPGFVMQGQIDVPYFLPDASAEGTPAAVNTGTWVANSSLALGAPSNKVTYRFPFAAKQKNENIPFILSIPDKDGAGVGGKPAGGWPVVIFQHGVFGSRAHSIPIANQLGYACAAGGGAKCFATIAIDLPLHGLAPNSITGALDSLSALGLNVDVKGAASAYAAQNWTGTPYEDLHERHFGWRKTSGTDATPIAMNYGGPDGKDNGYAGAYTINLALPPASRDNLRQSAMDLMTLAASLSDIDIDGDGTGDLDTSQVYLIGHSLGSIVGTLYAAVNNSADVQSYTPALPKLQAVALENPGGNIIRLLENSPIFGPGILAGLSAKGVAQGTSSYETFMNIAQTAVESGDSINFARALSDLGTPILATEIYGDGLNRSTQDDTIPLNVDSYDDEPNDLIDYFAPVSSLAINAPLAGSEPSIAELNLASLTTSAASEAGLQGVVRFNKGRHITLIQPITNIEDPKFDADVFTEIAKQLVSFFSSNGTQVAVGTAYPSTISAADPIISQ